MEYSERRALAEAARQSAVERAQRQYAQAVAAERAAWDAGVAAAQQRFALAESALQSDPSEATRAGIATELDDAKQAVAALPVRAPGAPVDPGDQAAHDRLDKAVAAVAALTEFDQAKAAVDALTGAPDGRDLADQLDRDINAANLVFNQALQRGFE